MLWDLSAAFDPLDAGIFCAKIKIYGFDKKAVTGSCPFLLEDPNKSKLGGPFRQEECWIQACLKEVFCLPYLFPMFAFIKVTHCNLSE